MPDCGVCLSFDDDGNSPSFYNCDIVVARKTHMCCECRDIIDPKAKYERASGKWDFGVMTYKTCLACVDVRDSLACDGHWVYGALWETMQEVGAENFGASCLNKLDTVAGKEKLRAWWNDEMSAVTTKETTCL